MLFEEMVKDLRKENDNKETDKIFNAIHKQAYWNRMEEENKKMLASIARQERIAKEKAKKIRKQERKEAIIERVKDEVFTALMLIMISSLFFILFILAIK